MVGKKGVGAEAELRICRESFNFKIKLKVALPVHEGGSRDGRGWVKGRPREGQGTARHDGVPQYYRALPASATLVGEGKRRELANVAERGTP
jgi:hypothetical protein